MATIPEGIRTDVEIWTDAQRIQGKVFVPSDKRLSDCLNDAARFLSVTSVTIKPLDSASVLWEGAYLAVNKSAVNVIRLLGDNDAEGPTFEVA
ncbi:MAG TPA: hypothetical protein VGA73_10180 [Candidatus Binatia bacterium]